MSSNQHVREPICGQANQPAPLMAAASEQWADVALLARKGRLYVLATEKADAEMLSEVYRRYYTSTSYDILPTLRGALQAVYDQSPQARAALPVAWVMQGLSLFIAMTEEGAAWLVRSHEIRWLGARREEAAEDVSQEAIHTAQRRLHVSDVLVVTTRSVAGQITHQKLRRLLYSSVSPTAAAQSVARSATRGAAAPVTVMQIPSFSPVPDLGPTPNWSNPRAPRAELRPERRHSPIVPAVILAAIAISISLWVNRSQIAALKPADLVMRIITTPTATATPLRSVSPSKSSATSAFITRTATATPARAQPIWIPPTPTPTPSPTIQSYAAPVLLSPRKGAQLYGQVPTLRWTWAGVLKEDEYFDVRLARWDKPPKSIAWTKGYEYTEFYLESGGYAWTVVVVRGKDGVWEREMSEVPEPLTFSWQPEIFRPTPLPTPIPLPTR